MFTSGTTRSKGVMLSERNFFQRDARPCADR